MTVRQVIHARVAGGWIVRIDSNVIAAGQLDRERAGEITAGVGVSQRTSTQERFVAFHERRHLVAVGVSVRARLNRASAHRDDLRFVRHAGAGLRQADGVRRKIAVNEKTREFDDPSPPERRFSIAYPPPESLRHSSTMLMSSSASSGTSR